MPCIRDVLIDFFQDFAGPGLVWLSLGSHPGPTWTLPFGVTRGSDLAASS